MRSGWQLGERDHSRVHGAAEIILNAVLLRQGLHACVELSGQCVRFGVWRQDGGQRARQLGGRALPSVTFTYQLLYGGEQLVRFFVRLICAVLNELPVLTVVKFQLQPEILLKESSESSLRVWCTTRIVILKRSAMVFSEVMTS